MPRIVEQLTEAEQAIEREVRAKYTEEQMCAYFLTKTIRSQYRFDDAFIAAWYAELFGHAPEQPQDARRELVRAYTEMLMFENKYRFHLDYWLRQYQERLITDMEAFFGGEAGQ